MNQTCGGLSKIDNLKNNLEILNKKILLLIDYYNKKVEK